MYISSHIQKLGLNNTGLPRWLYFDEYNFLSWWLLRWTDLWPWIDSLGDKYKIEQRDEDCFLVFYTGYVALASLMVYGYPLSKNL